MLLLHDRSDLIGLLQLLLLLLSEHVRNALVYSRDDDEDDRVMREVIKEEEEIENLNVAWSNMFRITRYLCSFLGRGRGWNRMGTVED